MYEGVEMQIHWFIISAQEEVTTAQHSIAQRRGAKYNTV